MEKITYSTMTNATSKLTQTNALDVPTAPGKLGSIAIWSAFGLLSLIGLVANGFMIAVLLRMKKTVFTVIVTGLCISDLISSANSPFYVYSTLCWNDYRLPWFFCHLTLPTDIASSMVTVHHVLLLSLVRLRGVSRSPGRRKGFSVIWCRHIGFISWFLSFTIFVLPYSLQMEVTLNEIPQTCTFGATQSTVLMTLSALSLTIGIYTPMLLIVGFCIAIWVLIVRHRSSVMIRTSSTVSRAREQQAILQLKTIVITFLVGYTTDYGLKMFMFINNGSPSVLFMVLVYLPHGVLRLTECLNPFLYYYTSTDIRDESWKLLKRLRQCKVTEFTPRESGVTKIRIGSSNRG